MSLLAPGWLALLALAVIVLVLHMRRRRQMDVPSVMIWRMVENSASPRRHLRWPPPSILLLLQLIVIALIAIAIAQPLFGADRADTRHTIYVVDASGSMRATDESPNRFETALGWVVDRIRATPFDTNDRVSVLSVQAQPRVEIARQEASSGILPVIEGLVATDGRADWVAAATATSELVRAGEDTVIVLVTDGADPATARFAAQFADIAVEEAIFGTVLAENVGLVARLMPAVVEEVPTPAPAEAAAPVPEPAPNPEPAPEAGAEAADWTITGTVLFAADDVAEVLVTVLFQPEGTSGFVNWAETTVARPDEAAATPAADPPADPAAATAAPAVVEAPFTLDLDLPGPGAVLVTIPDDTGPHDNAVRFVVPDGTLAARVVYIGEPTMPLLAALQAIEGVEVFQTEALPDDDETFDLVVVDGVTLNRAPETNVLWLGGARLASAPMPGFVADPYVTGWDTTHPLSSQIDWTGIAPGRTFRMPRLEGATVLAESNGIPLVQARTTPHGREVVLAFDIASSGWPTSPALPVFVSNLVEWLGVMPGEAIRPPCLVGSPCGFEARLLGGTIFGDAGAAVWTAETEGAAFLLAGVERTFVPERAGFYRLVAGNAERILAVNAWALGETALAPLEGSATSLPATPGSSRLWWWLLLIALIVLAAEAWVAGRGPEQFLKKAALARTNPLSTRRRLQLGFRTAACVFLVAALVGIPWIGREPAEDVVVVMGNDLGGDVASPDRNRLLAAVQQNLEDGGRGGLVTTGGDNRIATDLGGMIGAGDIAGATPGTNLEEAVRLAAAMVPGDRPGRIVLATDGNETEGEIAQAIAALQARGITVDIQPMNELPTGEVLVEAVNAPPKVYDGDLFLVDAVIFSQGAKPATVTISRAGEVIYEQQIDLFPGRNRIEVPGVPAGTAGNLLLEVAVAAEGDTYAQNNLNGTIVAVQATPSIAIVTPQPPLGEYFAGALAVQGLTAEIIEPANAPTTIDGWLGYDAVVLMNVPAIDLDTTQQEQLEEYVQTHGRGLLILGGENSFGPGGYYQTPFERMSPLSSRVPHELPEVSIVYVLDRSGSMSAAVGDVTRLDIAKSATLSAVDLLSAESRVGIVLFDSSSYVLVPLQDRKNTAAIETALLPVVPGGGTNIYPGLEAALGMLANVQSDTRHIVVMTDGITAAADFPNLVRIAQQLGITVSTIAIGVGDDERLAGIAAETGGEYYATRDFQAMPSILAQEALMLAGDPIQERVTSVVWLDRTADFLAGWPETLPPIYSYVVTTAKPLADVHIGAIGEDGETSPLLATWRYGNGHVLALATHGAGAGTAEWIQLEQFPSMWSQVIREFLAGDAGPGLHVSLERGGDEIRVVAEYLDPAGAPLEQRVVTATIGTEGGETFPLEEVGPGRYEGTFAVGGPGTYHVAVAAEEAAADAEFYVAFPARYDFGRADFDKLRALAAATGGEVLLGDQPVFATEMRWTAVPGWRIWALIALALFLGDLIIRHAPNLVGLQRRARPLGPALAVPA